MKIYQYQTNVNDYSTPFDWDHERRNIKYIKRIVESYFYDNKRVGSNWNPSFFGVNNQKLKLADLGSLVSDRAIIMSKKALSILKVLMPNAETLPYPTEAGDYYLVNVLDEDAYLDRQQTDCDRILPNGLCAGINKYVFDSNSIADKHIFFIPDAPLTCFVSGDFIEACKQHKLQGIYLTESVKVWDSQTA